MKAKNDIWSVVGLTTRAMPACLCGYDMLCLMVSYDGALWSFVVSFCCYVLLLFSIVWPVQNGRVNSFSLWQLWWFAAMCLAMASAPSWALCSVASSLKLWCN